MALPLLAYFAQRGPSTGERASFPCERMLVELRGFEPLTPSMRTRCATGLRYSPENLSQPSKPRALPAPRITADTQVTAERRVVFQGRVRQRTRCGCCPHDLHRPLAQARKACTRGGF